MHTILGINGTVGPYLAEALHEKKVPVRGISRRPFEGPNWDHVQADLLNLPELIAATDGSTVIYLLIGLEYNIKVWERDWPIVMQNTIEACLAHNAKLVFMDNVYAYGLVKGVMTEETPYHPNSKKGAVRKAILQQITDAEKKSGLRACIGRAPDFYGPRADKSAIAMTVVERHLAGKKAQWIGNPKAQHTFGYSVDLGKSLAFLGTDDRADGQVWHLPSSSETWTGEDWIAKSAALTGAPSGYTRVGSFMLKALGLFVPMMREVEEMNYQFEHDYVFSSQKFEKTFGYKPTPYYEGLKQMVAFFRDKK